MLPAYRFMADIREEYIIYYAAECNNQHLHEHWSMRMFLYLVIFAGFLGPVLFIPKFMGITFFPYRILLILFCIVLMTQVFRKKVCLSLPDKTTRLYMIFYLFWFAFALLSLAWAPDRLAGIKAIILLFTYILIVVLCIFCLHKIEHFTAIYYMWPAVLVIFLALAVWEVTTGHHLSTSAYYMVEKLSFLYRPSAVFFNTNDLSTYIVLALPFVVSIIQYNKNTIVRLAGILLCLIAFDILFYSDSKGNFMAAAVQAMVLMVLLWRKSKKDALLFVTITLLLMLLVPFPVNIAGINSEMPSNAQDLVQHTVNDVQSEDGSIASRIALIKNALIFSAGSYGLGVGAGNIEYMIEYHGVYDTNGIYKVHNWWLEVLVNYGILVFMGYLVMYLTILLSMFKAYQQAEDSRQKQISQALLLALVAFPIGAISTSSLFTFFPQWILFGLSIAYLSALKRESRI